MTNEQINIAIAEVCGWEWKPYGDMMAWYFNGVMKWCREVCGLRKDIKPTTPLPDYLNDLNAMHEAEKILTRDQIEVFCDQLLPKHHGIWWGIHTTSHQRAEAFLKAIGKWEE
jgi:hypothetical protein